MSARNRPRLSLDVLLVGVVLVIALLLVYQGIAMFMSRYGPGELAAGTPGGEALSAGQDSAKGLRFRLSEGAAQPEADVTPRPETEPLEPRQVASLLETLPALPRESDVARPVALTDEIPQPPLAGTTQVAEFPPAEERTPAPEPEVGPLQVVRFGPEGEVERARELSISFNQPMVPVTSHEVLAARDVPARLRPTPGGRWRWVGTRTLVFEVDAGFPMATAYRVEVPAGVRSAAGIELPEPLSWTFQTPPPNLSEYHPSGGPVGLQPIMFVAFDQRIDPDEVLERISVRAGGRGRVPIQRATQDEIEADTLVKGRVENARDGRWVAFRASNPLPIGSKIQVAVGPGTPSAEGPLTTDTTQVFDFHTYGPLRVVGSECGYDDCLPGAPLRIGLSNPLDEGAVDSSWVRVRPALANLRVTASHDWLTVSGRTQPRTTYRVTLAASLRDVFGQTLEEPATVRFNVESFPKTLTARGGDLVVLAPDSRRELVVKSVNHPELLVWLYRVEPRHWSSYDDRRSGYRDEERYQPPGELVKHATIVVDAGPDEISETRIDLSPALTDGWGQVIAVVEPAEQPEDHWRRQEVVKWIQATGIGLSAIRDADELVAWASALDGAAPIEGAEVRLVGDRRRLRTNAEGLATIDLRPERAGPEPLLVARIGDDVAFLPANDWGVGVPHDRLAWYVFTDRRLYRPGEEVHFKGWVREIEAGPEGDVRLPKEIPGAIRWWASDDRGNDVAEGLAEANDLLGFDAVFRLPEDVALGQVVLRFAAEGIPRLADREHRHSFQVQEYRRPEYEVAVTHDGGPHFVGGAALVTAQATYFAGGGLEDSEVRWHVSSRTAHFRPPNWDDFAFGQSPRWPWPFDSDEEGIVQELQGLTDSEGAHRLRVDLLAAEPPVATSLVATATIQDVNRQTWTESTHLLVHPARLYVGLRSPRRFVRAGEPLIIESIVVTPEGEAVGSHQVELRAARTEWRWLGGDWREEEHDAQQCTVTSESVPVRCEFETRRGGAYRIRAVVNDDEGRASLTEFTVWASGGRGRWRRGESIELIADRDDYQPGDTAEILVSSPFASAEAIMTLRREGVFEIQRFRVEGPSHVLRVPILERHTPNLHVTIDLVAATVSGRGGGLAPDPDRTAGGALNLQVPPRSRTLTLNAMPREREIKPGGETVVELELRDAAGRPVPDGDVALAVVDEAVLALLPEELQDPAAAFHPQRGDGAEESNLRQFLLLGPRVDTTATERGAVSGVVSDGETGAPLSGARIYLDGTALAVSSGSDGSYALDGIPAGNYTLIVELIGYGSSEERIEIEPGATHSLDLVLLPQFEAFFGFAEDLLVEEAVFRAPMAMEAQALPPSPDAPSIRMRSDFAALAVFVASARTDEDGRAEVPVRLPDNLTRYRVIAVGAAGAKRFGKGESTITASLPLMARPSPPRFLNFGDALELPVVVQNRSATEVHVDVAVRATNLTFTAGQGQRVAVPGEGRVEVRFPATTLRPGAAYVQVAAVAGAESDAAQVALPVWTPATSEAFATYGELDQGAAAIPVAAPGDVIDEYGGLEVTTSSTALQALTDALLYLTAYPYECAEQLASRILAVAALRDVLTAFEAAGLPEPQALVSAVERDIDRLQSMQNGDGGFSFWGGPRERSWPYISIHVAHALVRARAKGFDVPPDMLSEVRGYLRNIERHYPPHYSKDVRRTLRAYSLYVRELMDDRDPEAARSVIQDGGLRSLPLEAAGWSLAVLSGQPGFEEDVESIRRYLQSRASETAATAQFTSSYGDGDYLVLHSVRRTDAVILDALIGDQPQNDLIPKLVRGLLGHRKRGRWLNTQENAFVLLVMDRYFSTYESATPDFAARVWLGDGYAGGHEFRGRTTERHQIEVPMAWLTERSGTEKLILGKDGPGRLYYRIGLRYAPADLKLEAAEHGFGVERVYEAVDDPDDVRRDEGGTWVIRAGARVRVRLSMAAPARRYHVALVDPLPAGLEALNPELAGQELSMPDERDVDDVGSGRFGQRWWPWWRWYEHENLRDERVEVFTSLLWPGVHDYSYLARATTPGEFVVPPPKAEEMYHPETFGRGPTERVIVRE